VLAVVPGAGVGTQGSHSHGVVLPVAGFAERLQGVEVALVGTDTAAISVMRLESFS